MLICPEGCDFFALLPTHANFPPFKQSDWLTPGKFKPESPGRSGSLIGRQFKSSNGKTISNFHSKEIEFFFKSGVILIQ